MKKISIAALAIVLVVASAAFAAVAQQNTYSVTASTSPTKAGTKKKPVAIKLIFNYKVGETHGQRPAVVNKYDIGFDGLKADPDGPAHVHGHPAEQRSDR